MSNSQKKAAALVAMLFLAIPVIVLVLLTLSAIGSAPLGDRFPGSFALAVAADGDAAQTAFKFAPLIVTVGLSFVVPSDRTDWRFIVTVILCVVGIVAAGYLYFSLQGAELAHRFWSYTDIEAMASPDAITRRLRPSLLVFIGWFLSILAVQLGVKFVGGDDGEG